jgi:hypothetical protein
VARKRRHPSSSYKTYAEPPEGARLLLADPVVLMHLNRVLKGTGVRLRWGAFGRQDDMVYVWSEPVSDGRPVCDACGSPTNPGGSCSRAGCCNED